MSEWPHVLALPITRLTSCGEMWAKEGRLGQRTLEVGGQGLLTQ